MTEIKIVDAQNLSCPQPVILAKQALESNKQVKVIVDNETALENVKRLGGKFGCDISVETKSGGIYEIELIRQTDINKDQEDFSPSCTIKEAKTGPFVIVVNEDKMGRGNDELGTVLIKSFCHTIAEQAQKPDVMIFYNTGVKLTIQDSDVLDDLKQLERGGVQILVCGTCLNYFEIKEKLAVGVVSNMYDIVEAMSSAGRLFAP
ncbi:MAG: sulfurtransferase-like selenium metabolism protein YedF [Syntrophaceae bacterium]|nr:sulfurtransferase-like selenium metabolism protein YedF [Syntrophaceae bacterium]